VLNVLAKSKMKSLVNTQFSRNVIYMSPFFAPNSPGQTGTSWTPAASFHIVQPSLHCILSISAIIQVCLFQIDKSTITSSYVKDGSTDSHYMKFGSIRNVFSQGMSYKINEYTNKAQDIM
jgi:hypothetical protein